MSNAVGPDDELIRHRIDVVAKGGGDAGGILRSGEVQFGSEGVYEDAPPDANGIARFAEHPLETFPGEESQVRSVE